MEFKIILNIMIIIIIIAFIKSENHDYWEFYF